MKKSLIFMGLALMAAPAFAAFDPCADSSADAYAKQAKAQVDALLKSKKARAWPIRWVTQKTWAEVAGEASVGSCVGGELARIANPEAPTRPGGPIIMGQPVLPRCGIKYRIDGDDKTLKAFAKMIVKEQSTQGGFVAFPQGLNTYSVPICARLQPIPVGLPLPMPNGIVVPPQGRPVPTPNDER